MFYHALGKPFAVAFNDTTFSPSNSALGGDRYYSTNTGKKIAVAYDDIGGGGCRHRPMSEFGGACSAAGGSNFADSDSYYHALGQKLAVAFNDHSFNDRSFNTYGAAPRQNRTSRMYFN